MFAARRSEKERLVIQKLATDALTRRACLTTYGNRQPSCE